ncbi:MAG: hemerythrin [Geobacteraceae bacterium GWC2_55_20]|nr:MAG: hemerythrin [Geobacteraceae bacterium GWC2_55_20]OGU25034.1 MAG: hemerythrin [Geobacteraceae bacterium GWF2_54_21]HBA72188.1 hemerythrin [Geobacter sp.]HCE68668.1 hemerythrin [Geobacter sp.]
MGIQWRDSLSVGVELIDGQHKELLLRFDRLLNACEEGKGTAELKKLLAFLEEYVVTHFRDEEALQQLRRYPEYEEHRAQHAGFVARIKELREETDKDGISTHHVLETNNMLLKWLLNHISKVDTKLGAFINSGTP